MDTKWRGQGDLNQLHQLYVCLIVVAACFETSGTRVLHSLEQNELVDGDVRIIL
jgi:hypothetical protein